MLKVKLINIDTLTAAIYQYGDEYVGKNPRTGEETTLIEELVEVGRLADRAELILCKDYYNRSYQKLRQDFSEEDLQGQAVRSIVNAGKKLLFLNGVLSKKGLGWFITEKVDKSNIAEMYGLVKSYQYNISTWNVF